MVSACRLDRWVGADACTTVGSGGYVWRAVIRETEREKISFPSSVAIVYLSQAWKVDIRRFEMVFARLRNALLVGVSVAQLGCAQLDASVDDGAKIIKSDNPSPSIGFVRFHNGIASLLVLTIFRSSSPASRPSMSLVLVRIKPDKNHPNADKSTYPVEILYALSGKHNMTLSTISFSAGAVGSRAPVPFTIDVGDNNTTPFDPKFVINTQIIATHDFSNAPPLDIIIVPGGVGDFVLDNQNNFTMEKFIASRFDAAQYVLSVCTGATTLARAGVLSGRRATTNKSTWKWATASRHAANVTWVPSARWVEDGKVWTSSGVAAGMDMMYAFAGHYWGWEAANSTVNRIEYTPHADKHWDAFAVVHNVSGVGRLEWVASRS